VDETALAEKIEGEINANIASAKADQKLWSDMKKMKPFLVQLKELHAKTQNPKERGVANRLGIAVRLKKDEKGKYDKAWNSIKKNRSYEIVKDFVQPFIPP
jgi:hypothetical protein